MNFLYSNNFGKLIQGNFSINLAMDKAVNTTEIPYLPFTKKVVINKFKSYILCDGLSDPIFEKNCDQNIRSLVDNKDFFDFTNKEDVDNFLIQSTERSKVGGATFHQIIYLSPGYDTLEEQKLSGLIILPTDKNGDILTTKHIKGILLYYHATIFSKFNTPSNYIDYERLKTLFKLSDYSYLFLLLLSNG